MKLLHVQGPKSNNKAVDDHLRGWTVSVLTWVVSRGCSYGFLLADSSIQKYVRKDNPTLALNQVTYHHLLVMHSAKNDDIANEWNVSRLWRS
jgi:hypothetical protein